MGAIVYVAENLKSGHRYVGVTSRSLARRRYEHEWFALNERGKCPKFHAALRKYGVDAFGWSILEAHASFDAACAAEARLIAEVGPEYNLTSGGEGTPGLRRSAEYRAAKSAAMKGRVHPREVVEARRLKLIGQKRSAAARENIRLAMIGRRISAEIRVRMSAAHRGIAHTDEIKARMSRERTGRAKRKAVVVHPMGARFESLAAAAASLGLSQALVGKYFRSGATTAGGLRFVRAG
jgi:group I intron endonuclease